MLVGEGTTKGLCEEGCGDGSVRFLEPDVEGRQMPPASSVPLERCRQDSRLECFEILSGREMCVSHVHPFFFLVNAFNRSFRSFPSPGNWEPARIPRMRNCERSSADCLLPA